MTRAKDISKIVTDADLSGTLDVTGAVTVGGLTVDTSNAVQVSSSNVRLHLFETDTTNLNTELMNQSGKFWIDTIPDDASSSKARLSVDHATGDISFYEDTGTTPKLFWDASEERLGLGTSSPNSLLDIKGSTGNSVITLNSATAIDTYPSIGKLRFYSNDNSTNSSGEVGSIETIGIGTWNGAENNAAMTFNLIQGLAGTTSPVEAMRIDSSGNVGIGTSSPTYQLDVTSSGGSSYAMWHNSTTGSGASNGFLVGASGNDATIWNYENATMQFATNNLERMRIDSSGNLLVGSTTNSTNSNLILTGATRWGVGTQNGGNIFYIVRDSDNVGQYMVNGSTSWTATSDERVKDIIEPITNAVEKVSSLRSVIGKYKADEETTRRVFLIAQDVQAVLPEAVNAQDDDIGTLGLQYTDIIPLLTAAIKEQQATITALEARITALETA